MWTGSDYFYLKWNTVYLKICIESENERLKRNFKIIFEEKQDLIIFLIAVSDYNLN